jgi:hypothetical protein
MMLNSKCSAGAVVLLDFLPILLMGQRAAETAVPLKNWVTPLYWQPNQAEREAAVKAAPRLQLSTNAVSNDALTFVAITPCRLLDTRGAAAGFNGIAPFSGPSIGAGVTVTIPVQSTTESTANTEPAPCGVIPTIAQAYSFNLTVVPHAGGAVDYVSLWPSGSPQPFVATLDDPQGAILSNAAIVAAGMPYGGVSFYSGGPAVTDVIIDMNGYFTAPTDVSSNTAIGAGTLASNTGGTDNTATGADALQSNVNGNGNTADGYQALEFNTLGVLNTAIGTGALLGNTTGSNNTASGSYALWENNTGFSNTANGAYALQYNSTGYLNTANGAGALQDNGTGTNNTASGVQALYVNSTGSYSTAIGTRALLNNTIGAYNIAIGYSAASGVSGANSNNIHIGNTGASADSGIIRIGTQPTQTAAQIAGIYGGNPATPNLLVCVDATGLLGTTGCSSSPSSLRFKEQVADMGDRSSKLFQLRPVTFFYKPQYDDGSHALQYGLIAEEVAKIYPEMVGFDKEGQPASVKYQSLAPMLLNEVQKQAEQIHSLEERLSALETLLLNTSAPVR